jgi:hypothetical protein
MSLNLVESWNQVYQKELHISWKKPEAGTKLVILNLQDGDFFSLEDPVSITLWESLMNGQTPTTLLETLQRAHPEVDEATLRQDIETFLGELVANKLICPCSAGVARSI